MPIIDTGVPDNGGYEPGTCTPMWASVAQWDAAYPDLHLPEGQVEELLVEATWLLSGLVGDRFHAAECWVDEYQHRPNLCKIELAHQPVDVVFNVTKFDSCSGVEAEIAEWCQLPGDSVRICCSQGGIWVYTGMQDASYPYGYNSVPCASCSDMVIRVEYRTKSNLPPGTTRNVLKLAYEFYKSSAGKPCALPERITSVSRQGVSWTILDPLDFLDKGLTGIGSIDQWISRLNMRGWAGMIDPLKRAPLLLSEVSGCGPDCTGTPGIGYGQGGYGF